MDADLRSLILASRPSVVLSEARASLLNPSRPSTPVQSRGEKFGFNGLGKRTSAASSKRNTGEQQQQHYFPGEKLLKGYSSKQQRKSSLASYSYTCTSTSQAQLEKRNSKEEEEEEELNSPVDKEGYSKCKRLDDARQEVVHVAMTRENDGNWEQHDVGSNFCCESKVCHENKLELDDQVLYAKQSNSAGSPVSEAADRGCGA